MNTINLKLSKKLIVLVMVFGVLISLIGELNLGNGIKISENKAEAYGYYTPSARTTALNLARGKRYVYGANTKYAVDCSAFAQQFIKKYKGRYIPRTTYGQMRAGKKVYKPRAGDLVMFNNGSHVGVYVGNGRMVDALNPYQGVGERRISWVYMRVTGYYRF